MKKVGLISDMTFTKHMQFRNYYYALLALYGKVELVHGSCDLEGIDILFIGGACHGPHMDIFLAEGFIDSCNQRDITVVLFSVEKMLDSAHPNHINYLNVISKSNNFIHYTYDVDDGKKLGTKLFRVLMSKHYKNCISVDVTMKENKIVFIGCIYPWRKEVLDYVSARFEMDIFNSVFLAWEEYMRIISRYRFVLSPLGDANAFVAKFYEILLIHSIPIQQVKTDTLQYYEIEAKYPDCIFFENLEELPKKIKRCPLQYSQSEIWLEDYLEQLLKSDNLL
jgi:hypothetical protein